MEHSSVLEVVGIKPTLLSPVANADSKVVFKANTWWGGGKRQSPAVLVVIRPQDHLQLFGGLEPEIAEVWALY